MLEFACLVLTFLFVLLGYFKLADKFNIIDKPNERSSHTQITIRGGGVLFPFAWLLYDVFHGFQYPWMTLGVVTIAGISFLDDRMELSSRLRFLIHVFAFTCSFFQLGLFGLLPWWGVLGVYIVGIGCLNAVNFMDGINGMTGLYALSLFIPLQWYWFHTFWNGSLLNYLSLAILVFGFFNFRKKARCFAGDVGSISIGYIIVFFLLILIFNLYTIPSNPSETKLIIQDSGFSFRISYILLLSLYGFDVILTLVQRLYLRENIFQAHRRHLYQLLVNEYGQSHLLISIIYALIQLLINFWILNTRASWQITLLVIMVGSLTYSGLKYRLLARLRTAN